MAIALASLLPSGCAQDYPQANQHGVKLQTLTPKEFAIALAAAEVLLAGVPVKPADVAARIDAELATAGDPMRSDFKSVLGLVEHLTPLGGRMRRFTELTVPERMKYLAGWSRSRFKLRRGAYFGLKGFTYYFAYTDPVTRSLTGFKGPWPERVQIAVKAVDFGPVA